jgi:hypothetical protein
MVTIETTINSDFLERFVAGGRSARISLKGNPTVQLYPDKNPRITVVNPGSDLRNVDELIAKIETLLKTHFTTTIK